MTVLSALFAALSFGAFLLAVLLALAGRTYPKEYLRRAIGGVTFFALAATTQALEYGSLFDSSWSAILVSVLWLTGALLLTDALFELVMHRPPIKRKAMLVRAAIALAVLAGVIATVYDRGLATLVSSLLHGGAGTALLATSLLAASKRGGGRRLSLALVAGALGLTATAHFAVAAAPWVVASRDALPLLLAPYTFTGLALLLAVFEDERESAMLAASQIELLAYHDPLTGLPNRALFFDRTVLALSQAERYNYRVAVLFFDLDRFKQVNDSLGHHVGDVLLRGIAERTQGLLRLGDTFARFGGDEFTVLIPRVDSADDCVAVAHKVLRALRQPMEIGSHELVSTASVGIAIYPDDGGDSESLIRNADAAMYRAKERGGDTYELYSPALSESALAKLEIESRLRRALEKGELELHYHPMIRLRDHSVFGVEALLRWRSAEYGFIAPQRFIEAAEVSGLIFDIGEWALREACRQISKWQIELKCELSVCVNLSARQFHQPDLLLKVQRALAEAQLAPSSLELEITENNLMDDAETTLTILRTLKSIGVRIAIDDFGTGYSSLSYLQKFPVDTIKLDRSFVTQSDKSGDAAIIRGVISIAHGLGMKVVAEGVESEEQLTFLRENSCDVVQGYLFTEPLPPEEFSRFVRQHRELVAHRAPVATRSDEQPAGARRALVVDDDQTIRSLVQRILQRGQFEVDVAHDGEEALELIRKNSYSAIFLDLMMPRVDGYHVLETLKEEKPVLLRRIVVMTAVAPDALQRLSGTAIARVLPKPFDINQILASANDVALIQRAG